MLFCIRRHIVEICGTYSTQQWSCVRLLHSSLRKYAWCLCLSLLLVQSQQYVFSYLSGRCYMHTMGGNASIRLKHAEDWKKLSKHLTLSLHELSVEFKITFSCSKVIDTLFSKEQIKFVFGGIALFYTELILLMPLRIALRTHSRLYKHIFQ